jgi:hypothetical protein
MIKRQLFSAIMQAMHQQAEEALSLLALRQTASHLLNYGIWVAASHLKTFMDIPPVASHCNRIYQALQLACDLAAEQHSTQLASAHGQAQQYTRNDSTPGNRTAERLKALQRSRKARVDGSQCMMWAAVCDAMKKASLQRTCKEPRTSLLVVDPAAVEVAFEIVSASGLKVSQLQPDLSSHKVRPSSHEPLHEPLFACMALVASRSCCLILA